MASTYPAAATNTVSPAHIAAVPQGHVVASLPNAAVPTPTISDDHANYQSKFKGLGITQVVLGVVSLGLGIAVAVIQISTIGSGIWGGIWFIIAGSVCILSGAKPSRCSVIAGLTLSIIAALIAMSVVGVEGFLTAEFASQNPYYYYYNNSTTVAILHGVIAFTSFCELIIAITYSAYCCKVGCGRLFEQNSTQYSIHTNNQPTTMTNYSVSHPPTAMYQQDSQFRNKHQIPMTNYPAFMSQPHGQQQLGGIGYLYDARGNVVFPFRLPEQQQLSTASHLQNARENSAFPFRLPQQRGPDASTYSPNTVSYAHPFSVPERRHDDTQTSSTDLKL